MLMDEDACARFIQMNQEALVFLAPRSYPPPDIQTTQAGTSRIPSLQTCSDDLSLLGSHSFDKELPPEIWLKIFELLVYIPGVLEISDGRAIEAYTEDSSGIVLHGLYGETMKLKLTISLVSWSWRRLILPLLFEYVMIKGARHAEVVANALARVNRQQGKDKCYGRWIKRVEVLVQNNYWEHKSSNALVKVLKLSPNVLVFSDYFSSDQLPEYATHETARMLQKLCEMGRLRRIESYGSSVGPLHRLLRGCPSLEVFMTKKMPTNPVSLPKLHTLVIRTPATFFRDLETLKAPSLCNLIVNDGSVFLDSPSDCFRTCMDRLYPNLKHSRLLWIIDKRSLRQVADMPGLTSLTLDLGFFLMDDNLETLRIVHQTLQRINLVRFLNSDVVSFLVDDIDKQRSVSDFLLSLLKKDDNPSLRTIGFHRRLSYFDPKDYTNIIMASTRKLHVPFWENFLVQCNVRGVNVEASVGASDQFWGRWQPFHIGLVPHSQTTTVADRKIRRD